MREQEWTPPAFINLGILFDFVNNSFYTIATQIAFQKSLLDEDELGQSSFKSLFSDWKDFPRDVDLSAGLAYEWKPLYLGNDFTFFQEMYIGNNSYRIKNGSVNILTHGANIGLGYKDFCFHVGYAGTWFFKHVKEWYSDFFSFPRESWEFSVRWTSPEFLENDKSKRGKTLLNKINLSVGAGYSVKIGRYAEPFSSIYGKIENNNSQSYYIDAGF